MGRGLHFLICEEEGTAALIKVGGGGGYIIRMKERR